MPLLELSKSIIADALIGGSDFARFNNANAHLCVGDGTAAFDVTHTDLQGASKVRQAVSAGYPDRTDNAVTFQAVFDGNTANFPWNEWGVANGASGEMLNRAVQALGSKESGTNWTLTAVLEFLLPEDL